MADRLDYFFRQRVTETELDLGFELLERADRNLAADLGFVGVVAGAVVSQHAPVPDLTVDVSGPGAVYDQLGERVFFSSLQNVNVAQDDNGVSTAVAAGGNEKIVSVFVKFDRSLSDPRVDGNSLTVFFRRDESFRFIVAQGAEAPAGTALPPPLRSDAILLGDITRTFGQTQILNANISTARRQDAFVVAGSPQSLRRGRTIEAVSDLLALYNAHVGGAADHHAASTVEYAGGGNWADGGTNPATTVEAQLDKIVADLAAATGAPKIGAAATAGAPNALAAGSVKSQVDALLGFINAHINLAAGAHAASAISYAGGGSWADGGTNPATTVEAQLDKVIADLAAPTGAPKIGAAATAGAPNSLVAGSVKSQVDALLGFINAHINLAAGAHAAAAITYAGGPAWLGGRTNPATTVEAQLDKIISDLADTAAADDGAERIGAQAVAGAPSSLAAGSVRSQLDQLLGFVNVSARTNVAQTWTATQELDGPAGEENPSITTVINPTNRKLLWAATGGTYGLRLYYTDRTIEITLNARWDGAQWVKDSTSFFSARFISNNFEVRWQLHTTATSPFAEAEWSGSVSRQFVFDTDGIGNGETLTLGREYDVPSGPLTGYSATEGEWGSTNANIGGGASFASGRLPAAPSSVTFTVHSQLGTDNSPSAFVSQRMGVGWFDGTSGALPATRWMFLSFSAT
jgi:hypothetical protein